MGDKLRLQLWDFYSQFSEFFDIIPVRILLDVLFRLFRVLIRLSKASF